MSKLKAALFFSLSLLALAAYAGFPLWLDAPVRTNVHDPKSASYATPTPTVTPLPIKVACIGDSITFGAGTTFGYAYPVQLQTLLGSHYTVRNYGVSGKTMLKHGDYPYWNHTYFTASQTWQPDIVVIMLGTNDSKPYNMVYFSEFEADATDMVNTYKNLASHPKVYLNTCPFVYDPGIYDITEPPVTNDIVPALHNVATATGATLIDVYTATQGMPANFPDTVHPNNAGALVIAQTVRNSLP